MGYTIELSYDVRKHGNISTVKNMIIDIAEKYDYDMIYNFMETEGHNKKITRNHQVIVISFDYDKMNKCALFIREIKKMHGIFIECVYEDEIVYKLLFASSKYMRKMERHDAKDFVKKRNKKLFSTTEKILLRELYPKFY